VSYSKMSSLGGYLTRTNMKTLHTHSAFTLLMASLIGSIMLSLAIFMVTIAQKEVLLSTLARDSQYAFYAADAGSECALYWDFLDGFAADTPTHIPSCSGQVVGEIVSGISADSTDFVIGGRGYGVPSRMQFNQGNRCVIVTVLKTLVGTQRKTTIDSRGYNLPCSNTTSNRRLERAVLLTY
jgi:hypothetical protein